MTNRQDRDAIYVKRQFDTEIIVLCVRWYIAYRLSYRHPVAMMAERGVTISHTTEGANPTWLAKQLGHSVVVLTYAK